MIMVRDRLITTDIDLILNKIRDETTVRGDTYLKDIKPTANAIMCTCPFHKNHRESKPACGVFTSDYGKFKEGDYHCFACGATGDLIDLVEECLHLRDREESEDWLIDTFGNAFIKPQLMLSDIELANNKGEEEKPISITEEELDSYRYYHPYMWERGLTPQLVERFDIGYNKNNNSITFPIKNIKGELLYIIEREITTKRFIIPPNVNKPVYLLNEVVGKKYPYVVVCEGQFDALTCWKYGVPAVALFGLGSNYQYDIMNKTDIRCWVTWFDNDCAGQQATKRFNYGIRNDVFKTNISFKDITKKDINELTEEEFNRLLKENGINGKII